MAPIELDTVHYNARIAMIYDAWTVSGLYREKTRQFASASAVLSTRSVGRSNDAEQRVQGVFESSTRVENGGNARHLRAASPCIWSPKRCSCFFWSDRSRLRRIQFTEQPGRFAAYRGRPY